MSLRDARPGRDSLQGRRLQLGPRCATNSSGSPEKQRGDSIWPGHVRRSAKSASAWRSTATWPGSCSASRPSSRMIDRAAGPTALVLGSAAGGGFPQWNCGCRLCALARAGDPRVRPATQASVAVTATVSWLVVGASPDLRQQISRAPALRPRAGRRDSPIIGVVLIGGDVDAIAGLLVLRERQAFNIYAPRPMLDLLAANPIFDVLDPALVRRVEVAPLEPVPCGGRLDADAAADAGQGAAVPRGPGGRSTRGRTDLRGDAAGGRSQRDRRARLRRDHRRGARATAAPTWCSSTARCSPTTR